VLIRRTISWLQTSESDLVSHSVTY